VSDDDDDWFIRNIVVVYYESINRELKIRGIYECRCDALFIMNR